MLENGQFEAAPGKSLFRIGEVSRLTETKPFVLRYWETEFPMLQPVKSPKGHRLYRREDVATVLQIKRLLYEEGFTIAGARKHLRESNGSTLVEADEALGDIDAPAAPLAPRNPQAPLFAQPAPSIDRQALLDLRDELRAFLTLLETE